MKDPEKTGGARAAHSPVAAPRYEPPAVEKRLGREDLEREFLYGGVQTPKQPEN